MRKLFLVASFVLSPMVFAMPVETPFLVCKRFGGVDEHLVTVNLKTGKARYWDNNQWTKMTRFGEPIGDQGKREEYFQSKSRPGEEKLVLTLTTTRTSVFATLHSVFDRGLQLVGSGSCVYLPRPYEISEKN